MEFNIEYGSLHFLVTMGTDSPMYTNSGVTVLKLLKIQLDPYESPLP